jgi:integrase
MRLGELSALPRADVDLGRRVMTVKRTYTAGVGVTTPKSGKGRTVNLTENAARAFREWFEIQGVRGKDALVFANEGGGYLDPAAILKRKLYKAMLDADAAEGRRKHFSFVPAHAVRVVCSGNRFERSRPAVKQRAA